MSGFFREKEKEKLSNFDEGRLFGMPSPLEVFCCYAREDQEMLLQLKKHLAPLQRRGQITIWSDTDLGAGIEWERELHQHLESADIILLLISPDFMSSDYCYSTEMERALSRHRRGEARVIPILLRSAFWEDAPFAHLQLLPTNTSPVKSWTDIDEALSSITKHINVVISEIQNKRALLRRGTIIASSLPFVSQYQIPEYQSAESQVQEYIEEEEVQIEEEEVQILRHIRDMGASVPFNGSSFKVFSLSKKFLPLERIDYVLDWSPLFNRFPMIMGGIFATICLLLSLVPLIYAVIAINWLPLIIWLIFIIVCIAFGVYRSYSGYPNGLIILPIILFLLLVIDPLVILIVSGSWLLFLVIWISLLMAFVFLLKYVWKETTGSALVITADRFFWGNWQTEHVDCVYYYHHYTSISISGRRLITEQSREIPRWFGRGTKIKTKAGRISLPPIFEPFEDCAQDIIEAHTQFYQSLCEN